MASLSAVILAAGKGKRMRSDLPKVAHEVAGAPMVLWVARACAEVGCQRIILVVGHGQEHVRAIFEQHWPEDAPPVEFAVQDQQLGTGHAVLCAAPLLADEAAGPDGEPSGNDVFVLAGDGPLIRAGTLVSLLERHRSTDAAATMATSTIDDPRGYGRIVRNEDRSFAGIVEEKDATDDQRAIREVNPSYYCFDTALLFQTLSKVTPSGASGEYYVTDVPAMLAEAGRRVEVVEAVPPDDVLSINTPEQLAEVDAVLRRRLKTTGSVR